MVTIGVDAHHLQRVAGGFPFGPEALLRPGVKGHHLLLTGFGVGGLVHKTQHEHLARGVVLDHGRQQPF